MQERQVTVAGRRWPLPRPFLVLATENSIETEGVYPLPEAQVERFLFSIHLEYPSAEDEMRMAYAASGAGTTPPGPVLGPARLTAMQRLARLVPVAPSVHRYALAIVRNSRPGASSTKEHEITRSDEDKRRWRGLGWPFPFPFPKSRRRPAAASFSADEWLRWGASPRAGQALIAGGKVLALARGRTYVTRNDLRELALPVLAHRLIPGFRAGAGHVGTRELVRRLLVATDEQLETVRSGRPWRDILVPPHGTREAPPAKAPG